MRYPLLDWLRGFAILLMVIYHSCYDLFFFGYLDTAFGKGYWIPFRYVIVILFVGLVGVVTYLVHKAELNTRSLWKRTWQLGVACLFVTLSSYFIAPTKMTLFGILHFILLSSLLAIFFVRIPKIALVFGISVFVSGHVFSFAELNSVWLHWIGMVAEKRPALDYVPMFPWFGIVLIGVFVGYLISTSDAAANIARVDFDQSNNRIFATCSGWLKTAGQHSLIIYLLHQPLMFAGFYLVNWFA